MTIMVLRIGVQYHDENDNRSCLYDKTETHIKVHFAGQHVRVGGNVSKISLVSETIETIF